MGRDTIKFIISNLTGRLTARQTVGRQEDSALPYQIFAGWDMKRNVLYELFQRSLNVSNRTSVPSFIDSGYELFSFSGLLKKLKCCQQPFTNVLLCSKVGIIRNDFYLFIYLFIFIDVKTLFGLCDKFVSD